MKRPLSESLRSIDAASLNSDEFNRYARSLVKDATVAFNRANELETEVNKSLQVITNENILLYKRIAELDSLLNSLEATINNRSGNLKTVFETFYFGNNIIPESVHHEPLFSLISLPQTDLISSIYRDYDKEFLRRSTNISYSVHANGSRIKYGDISTKPDLVNIIDGDLASCWIDEVTTDADIDHIDFSVTINNSTKILPSLLINALSICPYPMYNMDLISVTYKAPGDPVETVRYLNKLSPEDTSGYFNLPTNFSNVKFVFPEIAAGSVTITIRQPNFINLGDKRRFVFGLRQLGAEYMNISAENGSFVYKYALPFGKTFSSVNMPESIDYASKQVQTNDQIKYELLLGQDLDTSFLFNSRIRSLVDIIGIRVTLSKRGSQIPYMTGIKFDFETK